MAETPRLRSHAKESATKPSSTPTGAAIQRSQPATFLDSTWTWSDPSSWPLSIKFLPIMMAFVAAFLGVYINNFYKDKCVANFEFGFEIGGTADAARGLIRHPWQLGVVADAIRELRDPQLSVFASNPFPEGRIPRKWYMIDKSSAFVDGQIEARAVSTLFEDSAFVSEAAAFGVSAVMLAQHDSDWEDAVDMTYKYYSRNVPKNSHGALHHSRTPEGGIATEAVYTVPPFLAYYAVWKGDPEIMNAAVHQIQSHRSTLNIESGAQKGLWKHSTYDPKALSMGNAMAAYGILRVRATIHAWNETRTRMLPQREALDRYVLEILHSAIETDTQESGLLRNYLADKIWAGETTGTTLLAAAAYRMAVMLEPGTERETMTEWADLKRVSVMRKVNVHGIVTEAINSTAYETHELTTDGTLEGQAFLLILASAWRDCLCAGVCRDGSLCDNSI